MYTKHSLHSALIVLVAVASIFAVLVALFPFSLESGVTSLFTMFFSRQSGLMMLGIALLLIVVSVQWFQILKFQRINKVPLSEIERLHPKLPASLEVIMTVLLSTALIIFFVQLASVAHSVLFTVTLTSSTVQTNDTRDLMMSDFDADGDLDYIAGNLQSASEQHDVYLNSGTGAFTRVQEVDAAAQFVAFDGGDLNGDGRVDFFQVTRTAASVYLGTGTGSFRAGPSVSMNSYSAPNMFIDIALGDVDSDGDLDAVAASKGTIVTHSLFRNNGKAAFTQTAMNLATSSAVTLFDANQDDYLDLALVSNSQLKVYRNAGTGTYVEIFSASNVTNLPVLAHGNLDGDNDIDLVTVNSSQQLVVWRASGTGGFTALSGANTQLFSAKTIALADLDSDGDLDVVVGGIPSGSLNGGIQYMINDGNGVFPDSDPVVGESSYNTRAVAVGDIDNDSDLDWVMGNGGSQANRHFKTNQSQFGARTYPSAPSSLSATQISPSAITGATITNKTGTGFVSWTNASDAGRDDSSNASVTLASGQGSRYLEMTGFNFEIPSNATIQGITVTVTRSASGAGVYDEDVRLVRDGAVVGSSLAGASPWSSSGETNATYGGSSSLWGTTWTPSQINADSFGVAIAVQNLSGSIATANIDIITVTVQTNLYDIRLSWGSGSDAETSTNMLQYQPRVGTGSATDNILPGRSVGGEYTYRTMSAAKSRSYLLKYLPCGYTYYWSVRTKDHDLALSSFSSQSSFTISAECQVNASESSEDAGGDQWGGSFITRYFGGKEKDVLVVIDDDLINEPLVPTNGVVHVRGFVDLNKNGNAEDRERRISDLSATISGTTAKGTDVSQTLSLGKMGELSLSLAPGTYNFALKESNALRGYEPTSEGHSVTVEAGSEYEVQFGYSPKLLDYQPCLQIASDVTNKDQGSDALAFLDQLETIYGQPVLQGVAFKNALVTRAEFYTLVQRMLCIPLLPNAQAVSVAKLPLLSDMPLTNFTEAQLYYSLLQAGVPLGVKSGENIAANSSAYISRADAVLALYHLLPGAENDSISDSVELPIDVQGNTELGAAIQKLASLNVLHKSNWPIFNPKGGMTPKEVAHLLSGFALLAGKVSYATEEQATTTEITSYPTFLAALTYQLQESECLQSDETRQLLRLDVRPGDPFYDELADIAKYGLKNSENKMLWLDAGAKGLEYGLASANGSSANLKQPVPALEVLRSYLVLTCKGWLTKSQMENGGYPPEQGSGNWFATDLLFRLPLSGNLDFRIAAAAQHRTTYGNRSLISPFTSELIRNTNLTPMSPLSLEQFAALTASAILNIAIDQDVLSPTEAENLVEPTRYAVLQNLSVESGIPLAKAREVPATYAHLAYSLSTILGLRMETGATEFNAVRPTLAEVWREILGF